jgi:hypothetical protein
MTGDQFTKFKSAIDAAGIKNYCAVVDDGVNLYNSDNAICVYDSSSESIVNVRGRAGSGGSDGFSSPLIMNMAWIEDIHHVKFGATLEKAEEFFRSLGCSLDEDQKKILININKGNYNIKPITGDYVLAGFKVLSDEEIAKLSAQEKIDYEKKLEIYKERQKTENVVVSIDY